MNTHSNRWLRVGDRVITSAGNEGKVTQILGDGRFMVRLACAGPSACALPFEETELRLADEQEPLQVGDKVITSVGNNATVVRGSVGGRVKITLDSVNNAVPLEVRERKLCRAEPLKVGEEVLTPYGKVTKIIRLGVEKQGDYVYTRTSEGLAGWWAPRNLRRMDPLRAGDQVRLADGRIGRAVRSLTSDSIYVNTPNGYRVRVCRGSEIGYEKPSELTPVRSGHGKFVVAEDAWHSDGCAVGRTQRGVIVPLALIASGGAGGAGIKPDNKPDAFAMLRDFRKVLRDWAEADADVEGDTLPEWINLLTTDGPVRWDLIAVDMLDYVEWSELLKLYQYGADRRGASNWRKVDDAVAKYARAFSRHALLAIEDDGSTDDDSGFSHLVCACWNACVLAELTEGSAQ